MGIKQSKRSRSRSERIRSMEEGLYNDVNIDESLAQSWNGKLGRKEEAKRYFQAGRGEADAMRGLKMPIDQAHSAYSGKEKQNNENSTTKSEQTGDWNSEHPTDQRLSTSSSTHRDVGQDGDGSNTVAEDRTFANSDTDTNLTKSEIEHGLRQIKLLGEEMGHVASKSDVDEAIRANAHNKQIRLELNFIQSKRELFEFYRSFNGVLCDAFVAASAIQSGNVPTKLGTMKSCIVNALDLVGRHIPPLSFMSSAATTVFEKQKEGALETMLETIPVRTDLNKAVEEVSRAVTIALSERITCFDPGIQEESRLSQYLKKIKLVCFCELAPRSIFEIKGCSEAAAVLGACYKGRVGKGRFSSDNVLQLYFSDTHSLKRVREKRETLKTSSNDSSVRTRGEPSVPDCMQLSHSKGSENVTVDNESTRKEVERTEISSLWSEIQYLRGEMSTNNPATDTESLRMRLEKLEKKLPDEEDCNASGSSSVQGLVPPGDGAQHDGNYKTDKALNRATEASAGLENMRQMVEEMKQFLPKHESKRMEIVERRQFEDSDFSFRFAVERIKRLLDMHYGPDNHRWSRDPSSLGGLLQGKKSIVKHLQGSTTRPPNYVSGQAILIFFNSDCALGNIPRRSVYQAFDCSSEGQYAFFDPNERQGDNEERQANRSRLLSEP